MSTPYFIFFIDFLAAVSYTLKSGLKVSQADMAELADALDLGSGVHDVQVQVLLSARKKDVPIIFGTSSFIIIFYEFLRSRSREAL